MPDTVPPEGAREVSAGYFFEARLTKTKAHERQVRVADDNTAWRRSTQQNWSISLHARARKGRRTSRCCSTPIGAASARSCTYCECMAWLVRCPYCCEMCCVLAGTPNWPRYSQRWDSLRLTHTATRYAPITLHAQVQLKLHDTSQCANVRHVSCSGLYRHSTRGWACVAFRQSSSSLRASTYASSCSTLAPTAVVI